MDLHQIWVEGGKGGRTCGRGDSHWDHGWSFILAVNGVEQKVLEFRLLYWNVTSRIAVNNPWIIQLVLYMEHFPTCMDHFPSARSN